MNKSEAAHDEPSGLPGKQLAELVDWFAIRRLTARYNRAFDDGDGPAFASTFSADGVLELTGVVRREGREELATFADHSRGTIHVTADPVIDVRGDEATQDCTLLLLRRARDGRSVALETCGRYRDTLVRTAEGWLFRSRVVSLDANGQEMPGA